MTRRPDEGTTIVEFVAGLTLVAVLLLGVIQIALVAYAATVARHAAHEGARAAANGRGPADGDREARRVLAGSLGGVGASFAVASRAQAGRTVVEVRGAAPRVLPFVPSVTVTARSEAPSEGP